MKNNKPESTSEHVTQESQIPYTPDEGTYVQRTHKDKLFRFIFRDKAKLLQLYNAINQTSYEDVSQLTITTLENVIYLSYKNDVSFLLDWALCLVEHQSTWNPNIPLRGFLYFARLYRAYIEQTDANMYGTKQLLLPFPQFLVFYNGVEERPECEVLYLSDSYVKHPDMNVNDDFHIPALECRAVVLNINYGKNRELMEKCKPLLDYSRFIFYIRENIHNGYTPQTSVNLAVDRCLKEDVLTDVLKEHRQEVVAMFLDEYDDEIFTKRMYRAIAEEAREDGHKAGWEDGHKAGWEDGHKEGHTEGRKEGRKEGRTEALEQINHLNQSLIRDGRQEDLLKSFSDPDFQKELLKEYGLLDQDSSQTT